jgi:hypothetical protein
MALGPCDEIFFATYWGSRRGLTYENGYEGDLLFHIDPYDNTVVNHGVPAARLGFPTMASAPDHGLIYTIGVDPETNEGTFFAINATTTDDVFSAGAGAGFRSIGVDAGGRAYFSSSGGPLTGYDPESNTAQDSLTVPSTFLWATDTRDDGTIMGVMRDPDALFAITDGAVEQLSDAAGYTTSVGLTGDGSEFFYLPGAHGNASANGAILWAVDSTTGIQREVIALADIVREGLGVTLGGTYNLVVDGSTIYLGINVDPTGGDDEFGEVALLVIGLP